MTEQNNPSDWVQRQPNEKRSLPLDEAHMQQQDSESASVIVLQGWVTDLDTRPIAGATIFLRPSTALTRANPVQRDRILRERALGRISLLPPKVVAQAITNADGRYLIQVQALPPAVYQVVARQEDFAPQRQSWTWVGESDELDFQLGPGTSISGRVLDLDGSPLAGAEIEVLTQGDEGRGNWSGEAELIDQTRSDAGGYFRL
ncbi:MAG: carboxypeptidase regulatory-like domain-containing protein, partial [Proteobacteria bacterium]|nr:carboxypeptidase regulatory-like domain-containing protein [Pseudomonadota bacterium]